MKWYPKNYKNHRFYKYVNKCGLQTSKYKREVENKEKL